MHMHCKQPLWELERISKRQAAMLFNSVVSGVRAKQLVRLSYQLSPCSCGRKKLRGGRGFGYLELVCGSESETDFGRFRLSHGDSSGGRLIGG